MLMYNVTFFIIKIVVMMEKAIYLKLVRTLIPKADLKTKII